jgi:hypothetical protein
MQLAEAFYSPLQCLEICLRNNLHYALTDRYGENWYESHVSKIHGGAQGRIRNALAELERSHTKINPGDIVAALSFGFWVGLLGPVYDNTLWRRALYRAFRLSGRAMPRPKVHGRMNALRRFRNRIAHHEPIFQKDLKLMHDETIEAIHWLCPITAAWARSNSRVPAVIPAQFSN